MSVKKFGAGISIIGALLGGAGNSEQQGARAQQVSERNRRAAITREVNRNHAIRKLDKGGRKK